MVWPWQNNENPIKVEIAENLSNWLFKEDENEAKEKTIKQNVKKIVIWYDKKRFFKRMILGGSIYWKKLKSKFCTHFWVHYFQPYSKIKNPAKTVVGTIKCFHDPVAPMTTDMSSS